MVLSSFCMIKGEIPMLFQAFFISILHYSRIFLSYFVHKVSKIHASTI